MMARPWKKRVTKLSLWAQFSLFPWWNSEHLIKIKIRCSKKHEQKRWRKRQLTLKTYLPLLLSIGKAAMGAGGHTPSGGWVFTFLIMAQKVYNWKISDVVKKHWQKTWRNLNLTFKISMPLPIDVGKGVVRGGRPNSVYGLSFHLSHHGTESVLLKKLSDVVKETLAKMVKEMKSNLQNKHATAHWCWPGGGAGKEAKFSLWAEILPFPRWDRNKLNEKKCDIAMKKS